MCESTLLSIGTRVDSETVDWLDSMRRPGESRSLVIRRILESVMQSQQESQQVETVEVPKMPEVITWRFPESANKK